MLGIILWIVILTIIIYKSSKNSAAQKKSYKNKERELNKTFRNAPPQNTPFSGRRTAPSKPKEDILTRSMRNVAEDILTRSKRNVAEDFDSSPKPSAPVNSTTSTKVKSVKTNSSKVNTYSAPQKSIVQPSQINLASAPSPETLSDTAATVPSCHDNENLMQTVEDLIVKGYEPALTFERDFIAEGMDLLNKYY